jgi:DoxX-like protein
MKKNTALWIVQGVLAAVFLLAGGSKLVMSAEQLKAPGPIQLPVPFIRFIGVCETLGAIGMILPGITGIKPGLTPLAAAGLVIIMIGATVVNLVDGPLVAVPLTVVLGVLAAIVIYGRWFTTRGGQ